jgi:hypothetical protein
MTTSTADIAAEQLLVASIEQRHRLVTELYGSSLGYGELRQIVADVPRLARLAHRGLLDRALIQQHAGHAERADRVRDLHACVELPGSRLICRHCRAEFPCQTLVALDG